MKCLGMSLCVLVLCGSNLFAQNKAPKAVNARAAITPVRAGCICPVTNFGSFWIAEFHPDGSACQSPQPTYLLDDPVNPIYDYGTCDPDPSSCGINCLAGAPRPPRAQRLDIPPVLEGPVSPEYVPPVRPAYSQLADPRFILLTLDEGTASERRLYAKVFTVVVDYRQLVKDYNQKHQNDPMPVQLKTHPMRGDYQILLVGYECYAPFPAIDPKYVLPFSGQKEEGQNACKVNFGLHMGMVILAEQSK